MGCASCVKVIMIVSNLLILGGGIAVIVVGGLALSDSSKFEHIIIDEGYEPVAYSIIGVGVVIILLSFLGLFGAWKQNACLLTVYVVILSLLTIAVGAIAIVGLVVGYADVIDELEDEMLKNLKKYNDADAEDIRESWDAVQKAFKCCGVNGEEDWGRNEIVTPDSCYEDENKSNGVFDRGCMGEFRKGAKIVGVVSIVIVIVMFFSMIFSCVLCCTRKTKKYY